MSAGKSTALVFSTALLDELFYVFAVPLFCFSPGQMLWHPQILTPPIGWGVFWIWWGMHACSWRPSLLLACSWRRHHATRNIILRCGAGSMARRAGGNALSTFADDLTATVRRK